MFYRSRDKRLIRHRASFPKLALWLAIIKYWTMSQIALHPWLHTPDAHTGTYNGVEMALSFGDSASELAALRSGWRVFCAGMAQQD